MTHDELLASIIDYGENGPIDYGQIDLSNALRAVVELHKPMTEGNHRSDKPQCSYCRSLCHSSSGLMCEYEGDGLWPCDTILQIEKELK